MAVITINAKTVKDLGGYMSHDDRFKAWAKQIRGRQDVDLGKRNGYSLCGPFVSWGKSVAVAPGQFVVLAAETGSRARHEYHYALIGVDGDDQPYLVTDEALADAAAGAKDAHAANAANSYLYNAALYCYQEMRPGSVTGRLDAAVERAAESPQMMVARQALEALTEDERRALLAEFGR